MYNIHCFLLFIYNVEHATDPFSAHDTQNK